MTPFGQLESTFERRFEGTGLGLPLVQRLVELHGAEFKLESAPAKGTKGEVRFPRNRTIARTKAAPQPQAQPHGQQPQAQQLQVQQLQVQRKTGTL
jgi:hypothetical protein